MTNQYQTAQLTELDALHHLHPFTHHKSLRADGARVSLLGLPGEVTVDRDPRFVGAPGVRLVPQFHGRTLLAWTGFENGHFVVRAADLVNGHRGTAQTLSPTSEDAEAIDASVSGTVNAAMSISGASGSSRAAAS